MGRDALPAHRTPALAAISSSKCPKVIAFQGNNRNHIEGKTLNQFNTASKLSSTTQHVTASTCRLLSIYEAQANKKLDTHESVEKLLDSNE
ncbi:hypothetical protein EVAR_19583_1 [Eumeta japonica]|uniref:Uncharacterized protein n=1 Tax=Eumeta variegata TaxID=151549 RepID=A0A4C1UF35_EUMVA|nr:hypothetical protein EVAR_19583_1 [Eumeta japonica]